MASDRKTSALAMAALPCALALCAAAQAASPEDLTELSLEELMSIKVTSVAKKPQRLADAAAAVFVITQDDIRRSGVTSIPEALRMVPGCEVARINASQWAISCRGFNGRFANKLLVLMDGRTIYTPLFSGVFWEAQDTLLEDIERIEVIRGPGATLWGSNAVNGVINIITKSAKDTQGTLLTAGAGSQERAFAGGRYGTRLENGAYVRGYVKYFDRDGLVDLAGNDTPDGWRMGRGGFRLDWDVSARDALTVQGDIYKGEAGQLLSPPSMVPPFSEVLDGDATLSGGNLLTRWQRSFSSTSQATLQIYYDRTQRDDPLFHDVQDTIDLDLQHSFALSRRHALLWGLSYRFNHDDMQGTTLVHLNPAARDLGLFGAFVQDDITLIPDKLRLTLGSKFEHNDFSGFEVQPNIRLLWTPREHRSVWAAVSRAIRAPSRFEHEGFNEVSVIPPGSALNPSPLPVLLTFNGSSDFTSEKLIAYELGYRERPTDRLSVDVAVFYNDYKDLRTAEDIGVIDPLSVPGALVRPLRLANQMEGHTYGIEVAADWRPASWWREQLAYTFLRVALRIPGDPSNTGFLIERSAPRHQVSLRSSVDLRKDLDLDLWLRYAGKVDGFNTTNPQLQEFPVDSYLTLDARLAWRPAKSLELSLTGQNLLDSPHVEFIPEVFPVPIQVRRGVYGKIVWRF